MHQPAVHRTVSGARLAHQVNKPYRKTAKIFNVCVCKSQILNIFNYLLQSCTDSKTASAWAVSYTHLDVYKRQALACSSALLLVPACSSALPLVPACLSALAYSSALPLVDVYKRQHQIIDINFSYPICSLYRIIIGFVNQRDCSLHSDFK